MIVTKKVKIKINKGNLPYYSKIIKDIKINDIVDVPIDKLSKGSNFNIDVICDICNNQKTITIKKYYRSLKNNNNYACSRKCSFERNKNKIIKEYGVDNISKIPSIKEKIIKTNNTKYNSDSYFGSSKWNLEKENIYKEKIGFSNPQKSSIIREKTISTNKIKYGYENVLSSDEIRDKINETNEKKYKSKTPSKNDFVKNKIIQTNIQRYGGKSPMCDKEIVNKSKQTLIEKHGVDSPLKVPDIIKKIKQTNISNLGFEYPMQNKDVVSKRKENNISKYGVPHYHQYDLFRKKFNITKDNNYIEYSSNGYSRFKCDLGEEHNFEIKFDNYYIRRKNNIPLCTVCNPIGDNSSIKEKELYKFVYNNYKGSIVESYRDGLEIDIYLPELKVGFEFNGLYYHSNKFKDKYYHINKTKYFQDKGIRIIHIWEDDWDYKTDVIKSQILNWVGNTPNKIYARKCEVREINDTSVYREFLNENHIQGYYIGCEYKLGLFFNNELVSLITFDHNEGRKKMKHNEWNLSRFCNKLNTNVVGGATKLLKYFKKNKNANRIISYVDKDWSMGNLYKKMNFNRINDSKPDYKYLINNKRIHKSIIWKRRNEIKIPISELKKIYDCGKFKYEIVYL